MATDFSQLAGSWTEWSNLAGFAHATASIGRDAAEFSSDDESFHLRQDDGWWVVDEVDERGSRYNCTAKFSTFGLAEKYLVWRWASVARSALGAKQLGRYLHSLGVKSGVEVFSTHREYVAEIRFTDGTAMLPASQVAVFSHVLDMSLEDVGRMVREGIN